MYYHHIRTQIKNSARKMDVYNKVKPILFDVSLRDGIQKADPRKYNTQKKEDILHDILFEQRPNKIEVGSLASTKVLPIMWDSLKMYDYTREVHRPYYTNQKSPFIPPNLDIYLLVPSLAKMATAVEHRVSNISFITSISDPFQRKNTKKTIRETKAEFDAVFALLRDQDYYRSMNRKLYISCITECPLSGKYDIPYITQEICEYHEKYDFTELCLSDTCGTLSLGEFAQILDSCVIQRNVPLSKISLHLHIPRNPEEQEMSKQVVKYALTIGINRFDVSLLEEGGCSVTMQSDQLVSNMSYGFFYDCLYEYLEEQTNT
jgi:isopropylmalate/homocitrate/citramalate synthase